MPTITGRFLPLLTLALGLAVLLTGCGTYQGYQRMSMMRDAMESKPVFQDAEVVKVEAKMRPRKGKMDTERVEAFQANLRYQVKQVLEGVLIDAKVCSNCSNPDVTVRFEEEGYGSDMEAFLGGNALRGTLSFIDSDSGEVVKDELKQAETYLQLAEFIALPLKMKAMGSGYAETEAMAKAGKLSDEEAKKRYDRQAKGFKDLKKMIKPELREALAEG